MVTDDTILSIPQHPKRASLDIPPIRKETLPYLLSIARVLLNRLLPLTLKRSVALDHLEEPLIFVARQIQEKCREQTQELFMAFIDLTKAFDSINREALWKVLSRCGCPAKFITILRYLHDKIDMTATVLFNWTEMEPFIIRIGVKQGCVIASTLFNVYIDFS